MKTIRDFDLNTEHLPANGETRRATIVGDSESKFNLEIVNEDNYYYNFNNQTFQATKTGLYNQEINNTGIYNTPITFPSVNDPDQYDIYLIALSDTKHAKFVEYRDSSGNIDLNLSKGSNSKVLKKVIYQLNAVTLTLTADAPQSTAGFSSVSVTTDSLTLQPKKSGHYSFTVTVNAHASKSFRIIEGVKNRHASSYISADIVDQQLIQGEDDFPAVTNTDTVDGTVSSATKIVMDNNVADNMSVGDKVTGLTDGDGVTVVALNPDGDNVKEFSVSAAVDAADGATLSFSNQKFYRWNIDNIVNLKEGMSPQGTNVVDGTIIYSYSDTSTLSQDTPNETVVQNFVIPALQEVGNPTYTYGKKSTQPGMITFNKQQPLALAGDTLKFYAYGNDGIRDITGYDISFSNLKSELTEVTTTTTSAVSNSTTIPVAETSGIMNNVSQISGIGIDPSADDPTITTKSATSGAGNLTASAAQTLENGQTFTFPNAGKTLTITGDINVIEAGNANATVAFNLEAFIEAS